MPKAENPWQLAMRWFLRHRLAMISLVVMVMLFGLLVPGLPIVLCSLAFNCIGDGLRDALDPRLKM